ncbi:MAG: DNA polymerase III subunit epsilon, partial [Sideroxydans sp.]
LRVAKELHPGKKNNLNALCDRYQIDNSRRTLHGALLDTELLAEVYLGMTRGQDSLLQEVDENAAGNGMEGELIALAVRMLSASDEELVLHETHLNDIDKASKGNCLWRQLDAQT